MNIHAQELGKMGGKKSAESRLAGKSKKEISDAMSKLRKTKFTSSKKMVAMLNTATKQDELEKTN